MKFLLPWSSNLSKRFVKSPKIYLSDTDLASYLLGLRIEEDGLEGRMIGPLLETYIINELIKQASWSKSRVKIYHARTTTGVEVDIILENVAGQVVCIEIKNRSTVLVQDFKGISYIQQELGDRFIQGIVCCMPEKKSFHLEQICMLFLCIVYGHTIKTFFVCS